MKGFTFLAMSRVFITAHSSASRTSYFFQRKILFSFHQFRFLSCQQTVASIFSWSNLDLSVHKTRPAWCLLASFNACFLGLINMSPQNWQSRSNFSTGSTPFVGSIKCSMIIFQANHCLYRAGHVFCLYISELLRSSPG